MAFYKVGVHLESPDGTETIMFFNGIRALDGEAAKAEVRNRYGHILYNDDPAATDIPVIKDVKAYIVKRSC